VAGTGAGQDVANPASGLGSAAGAYFGTLPDGGVWALNVRADRRGMFLAHFPATGTAAIAEVTLGVDNRFQVTGTTLAPRGVVATAPGAAARQKLGKCAARCHVPPPPIEKPRIARRPGSVP
jgi:hypothetical protein